MELTDSTNAGDLAAFLAHRRIEEQRFEHPPVHDRRGIGTFGAALAGAATSHSVRIIEVPGRSAEGSRAGSRR